MVQLLEELPPELQAHIAGSLDDAAAAGRWAKASRASRLLLLPRIDRLLEARRSARQQAVLDKLSRARRGAAAALSVYDMGNGVAAIRVLPFKLDKFTCMCCPGNYELSIGAGGINAQRHLTVTSRMHWATYRQQVHGLGFDKVAWHAFAARASEFAGV
jgi:hypothetical protein